MDDIQRRVFAVLKPIGFRRNNRTFSRPAEDGMVQLVTFQLGAPTSSLYGRFCVNLGVFIPESRDARFGGAPAKSLSDADCATAFRTRLASGDNEDQWWSLQDPPEDVSAEVSGLLVSDGAPWLDSLATRGLILNAWATQGRKGPDHGQSIAAILVHQGDKAGALRLLQDEMRAATLDGRRAWLMDYARQLGVEGLSSEA
jgi:hypothetical protein